MCVKCLMKTVKNKMDLPDRLNFYRDLQFKAMLKESNTTMSDTEIMLLFDFFAYETLLQKATKHFNVLISLAMVQTIVMLYLWIN